MTMTCASARVLLLEADPSDLRGEGESPLAVHLRACAGCRARADAILAAEAELDAALRTLAAPSAEPAGTGVISIRRSPSRGGRTALAAATFAALAATVAGVILTRPPAARPQGATVDEIARLMYPDAPVAQARAGSSVAILKTNDPGVTVVWVY